MNAEGIPVSDTDKSSVCAAFDLSGRVAVITGGAGLLGQKHAEAVAEMGGIPCLVDINADRTESAAKRIASDHSSEVLGMVADITSPASVSELRDSLLAKYGRIDILINNAANNPKVENDGTGRKWSRFENFPREVWDADINVGLTGAFLCSQAFGSAMAAAGQGVILNIASDLGLIGPDQRIYRNPGETADNQDVKPVTYSVVKAGLIGLTRYLATYWPHRGVRANALAPGGVEAGQDPAFIERLSNLIPLRRMAHQDEYKSAVAFLVSDASSYMNGAVISMDGGRTAW